MATETKVRQAATVILLRPHKPDGFEVFLTRRPDSMPFLGGMYCFPGGTLSKNDFSPRMIARAVGLEPMRARQMLGAHLSPEIAIGHWIAAIRELFEEVGVLLATDRDGHLPANLDQLHAAITDQSVSFQQLLEDNQLLLKLDALAYFSDWQTPSQFKTRFDTRFFVTEIPPGQTPIETSYEVAHSLWVTPDRALQLFAAEELPMIFPTYASLRTLADFETIESVLREYSS